MHGQAVKRIGHFGVKSKGARKALAWLGARARARGPSLGHERARAGSPRSRRPAASGEHASVAAAFHLDRTATARRAAAGASLSSYDGTDGGSQAIHPSIHPSARAGWRRRRAARAATRPCARLASRVRRSGRALKRSRPGPAARGRLPCLATLRVRVAPRHGSSAAWSRPGLPAGPR